METKSDTKKAALQVLESMHDTKDKAVLARLRDILDLASTRPYTVDELADIFGLNYYTIYRNVRELTLLGLLEVTPTRIDRKYAYRTDWTVIKVNGNSELSWRSKDGDFIPISEWIERFQVGGEHISKLLQECSEALIALKVNKKLELVGENNYGVQHDLANRAKIAETINFINRIMFVLEQALGSPIWEDPEGHAMFLLPSEVTEEQAAMIHDKVELRYQQDGMYGN